jgi:hypothetical protein
MRWQWERAFTPHPSRYQLWGVRSHVKPRDPELNRDKQTSNLRFQQREEASKLSKRHMWKMEVKTNFSNLAG